MNMARSSVAVALAATTFTLLIIFQLLSHYGFPRLPYFHWTYDSFSSLLVSHQIPILSPDSETVVSDSGTLYLLGVGKADITGYRYETASDHAITNGRLSDQSLRSI